ncbi:MAG TPA: hypothetical protein VIM71_07125 [Lacunisphaera sp.]
MKHDPYFKYLAAVILVGVLLALADSTANDAPSGPASLVTASTPGRVPARS